MAQSIQAYLLKLPDEKRTLTLQIRDIIMAADPAISEAIKWNNLTFFVNKFNFAFIYSYKQVQYVSLAFFYATKLSDPKKLFEGTGQTMRHIKVKTEANIPAEEIIKWVGESLLLEELKVKSQAQ